jgi:hypothetical protein
MHVHRTPLLDYPILRLRYSRQLTPSHSARITTPEAISFELHVHHLNKDHSLIHRPPEPQAGDRYAILPLLRPLDSGRREWRS